MSCSLGPAFDIKRFADVLGAVIVIDHGRLESLGLVRSKTVVQDRIAGVQDGHRSTRLHPRQGVQIH